jgi:predicted SprT family Zn-dependent metalloprotease
LTSNANDLITENQIVKYQCDHCHMSYEKKKFLVSHLIRCHIQGVATRVTRVNEHKKFKIYNCTRCNFSGTESELHKHKVKNHRNYQCELCGKYFAFPHDLKRHHEAKHSEDRKYSCNFCGMRSKTLSYLQYHIRELHFGKFKLLRF